MGSIGKASKSSGGLTNIELYRTFTEGESDQIHNASEADKRVLDTLFKPATSDMNLYKGLAVTEQDLQNLNDVIKSYSSTTKDKAVATDYANRAWDIGENYFPLIANVKVMKGTPIVDTLATLGPGGMHNFEKEVTIGRNANYSYNNLKVHNKGQDDEYYTVDITIKKGKK